MMTRNQKAFLDMLANSEIGAALLAASNDGYNVLVGSTATHPLLFTDYSKHPRVHNDGCNSDAAGRYQLMGRFYPPYTKQLGLHDFSPASQDAIALQQIKECHAITDIEVGQIAVAIAKCAHIWASLPGANYPGQHMNKMVDLKTAFLKSGGVLA